VVVSTPEDPAGQTGNDDLRRAAAALAARLATVTGDLVRLFRLLGELDAAPPPAPAAGARDTGQARPILCAHADDGGQGAHWLFPGERCQRAAAPADTFDWLTPTRRAAQR
jgi:hypothetical protein